ncbi:MAG: DUF6379 domain-containing protein [Novosphingobium sp.]
MFDKYLIVDDSLRNLPDQSGFAFEARLGYYRGLGLSMIEELEITVDGEAIDRAEIRFHHGDVTLSLDEMESAYDRCWEFGAKATISVLKPGGLAVGEHALDLREKLRISYLPFPSFCADSKTLTVT